MWTPFIRWIAETNKKSSSRFVAPKFHFFGGTVDPTEYVLAWNIRGEERGNHVQSLGNHEDAKGLHMPHDDALAVKLSIMNCTVKRILIDSGRSFDIIFLSII